jgi:hypothetical protein
VHIAATRDVSRRIGAHVMARVRHRAVGRIDLCPTPGGFGTPAFGTDHSVLRISGGTFLVESTAERAVTHALPVQGATLRALATLAGADLETVFDVGHDTPPLGDVDEPLEFDAAVARRLGAWWAAGLQAIDAAVASLPADAAPGRARLWPEHFDLGTDVGVAGGGRVNLGASAGDGFHDEPYLYVGPWDDVRPGDGAYWNAPFGAVLGDRDGLTVADMVDFFREGLSRFA